MKKFNTKRSVSEKNQIYETYKICYFLFLILIFIDIVIKFNFYDFRYIFSHRPQRWLEFWVEFILLIIIIIINIIMLARKGITIGTGDLPKNIFQKRRYASISAKVGLIVAVSLWLSRAVAGAYPGSWWSGVFICFILMIYTFVVVFLLLYLIFFIAYKIAIRYNNSNKINTVNKQRLITENNEKNKIYKICYFSFFILIFIDMIVKNDIKIFFIDESNWWMPFMFELIACILILFINTIMLAVHGITIGIGDLPNNVFQKGRYASVSAITGLIVATCSYGYFIGWILIDFIKSGWLGVGIIIFPSLYLFTFIIIFLLLYVMFYIGYKIALEHNNSVVIAELNSLTNDTKDVETISTDSADTSVKK